MGEKPYIIFFIVAILLAPCTLFAKQPAIKQATDAIIDEKFETANKWLIENNLTITKTPDDAFIYDYVMVFGEGVPSANAKSDVQKRLTAERAATIVAYRNLAEILDGFAVVGQSLVKDAGIQYDVVRAAVTGFIKGAQVVFKEYNEKKEVALVIVKVGRSGPAGFGSLLYEKILGNPNVKKGMIDEKQPYQPKPVIVEIPHDGLIIDATDQNFRPALINRILNPKGEVIYDPSKISQKVLVEKACGEYTKSVEKAKEVLKQRGVKNSLVVKAIGTPTPSDLNVSEDDALKIYSANQKTGFFSEAKVAFVLK